MMAGRPDLMVVHGEDAFIVDVKIGRQRPWHTVKALPEYREARRAGEVVYPHPHVQGPTDMPAQQFMQTLWPLVRQLAAGRSAR